MSNARRNLILIGGGDFAREVLWFANSIPSDARDWAPAGFIDDDRSHADPRSKLAAELPYLGPIDEYQPRGGDVFVCTIGNPRAKLEKCDAMRERGAEFANLVHPTAVTGPGTRIGTGVIVATNVALSVDVTVGDFVTLNFNTTAGHDATIGDGCTVSSFCDITGRSRLGRGVFLGSHVSVLPKMIVEDFATVGAGSVVARRVAEGSTVMGVPARRIL